jgi:5'-deoxynucleotidase YfbR-like HD superfamily hydrolase
MGNMIEKVSSFIHEYLMDTGRNQLDSVWGPKYRWEHTLRVARWAWLLAVEEKADVKKCVVAALMHDVSHFVAEQYREHGVKSAEIAKEFLLKEGAHKDFVDDVAYAIKSHVGELNPKTLEAKVLQDADTLDRFGYFRILHFGKTVELSDLEGLKDKIKSSLEQLEKVKKGDFGPMWTKMGENKLKKLLNVQITVLKGVLEEVENTGLPELS